MSQVKNKKSTYSALEQVLVLAGKNVTEYANGLGHMKYFPTTNIVRKF